MVTEEDIIILMAKSLPECPLCGSDSGYNVTSVIKGSIQCKECRAEWSSLDFVTSSRLERLKIREFPRDVHSYTVGKHLLKQYQEYPISFWKSLRPSEKELHEAGPLALKLLRPSIIEILILSVIVLIGGYFRLTNLTEISSWHDYDEGVHSQAAILYIQGYTPYKDFFFTHPPLILYVLNVLYRFSGPNLGAGRMFSAVLSTLTVIIIYFIGRTSGSPITGYIASAFVAFDGYTIYNSRKLMLEPAMTFFTCLSYLAFLYSIMQKEQRMKDWLTLLSGVIMGLSISAKLAAVFNWVPLFIFHVLRRDKRALSLFLLSSIASVIILLIPFLAPAPGEVLKQILVFQVLRPADGTPRDERLGWMTSHEPDMIIVNLGILSLVIMASTYLLQRYLHIRRGTHDSTSEAHVALPILWALSVLFMFLNTKSFYGHYIEQIIPPFALLIGNLATEVPKVVSSPKGTRRTLGIALKVIMTLGLTAAVAFQLTIMNSQRVPTWENGWPRWIANELTNFTGRQDKILTFEPLFTFMAERTPAGLMCDSYGTMLYTGLGLHKEDLSSAIVRALTEREYYTWPMHDPQAQEYVVKLVDQSDYIILGDYRSDWQLRKETIDQISARTLIVKDLGGIRVLVRSDSTALTEALRSQSTDQQTR